MNKITAVVVFLLMSCPVYSREWRHGVRSVTALRAAASATAKSSEVDESDADNEADDQKSETDNDSGDMDTEDMDTDQNMDTDDADTNDTNMNEDMDDDAEGMNPVKSAIRASLKASALKQSNSSLGRFAAALDSGLSPRQTIKELLEPAESDFVAAASAVSTTGLADSARGLAGNAALSTTNGAMAVTAAPGVGRLTVAVVPEPAAWILAMTAILASVCTRRRPRDWSATSC